MRKALEAGLPIPACARALFCQTLTQLCEAIVKLTVGEVNRKAQGDILKGLFRSANQIGMGNEWQEAISCVKSTMENRRKEVSGKRSSDSEWFVTEASTDSTIRDNRNPQDQAEGSEGTVTQSQAENL